MQGDQVFCSPLYLFSFFFFHSLINAKRSLQLKALRERDVLDSPRSLSFFLYPTPCICMICYRKGRPSWFAYLYHPPFANRCYPPTFQGKLKIYHGNLPKKERFSQYNWHVFVCFLSNRSPFLCRQITE